MNIKTISFNTPDSDIFKKIVGVAKTGFFDGRSTTTYFEECRWFVERYECIMVFTRDIGYHTSGWWKNPDYERCYHLSISFPGGRNNKKLEHILNKFFGNNKRLLWCEPPYSEEGKRLGYIIIGSFAMKIGSQYFHVVRSILHSLPKWVGNHFLNYIE